MSFTVVVNMLFMGTRVANLDNVLLCRGGEQAGVVISFDFVIIQDEIQRYLCVCLCLRTNCSRTAVRNIIALTQAFALCVPVSQNLEQSES